MEWNAWLEARPEVQPKLSEASLCWADLTVVNLRGVDLSAPVIVTKAQLEEAVVDSSTRLR